MASLKHLYGSYKATAKKKGYAFTLNFKKAKSLFDAPCYYCKINPHRRHRRKIILYKKACFAAPYIYNGIDRKNPKKGYIASNVVPCCWDCNQAKGSRSVRQFRGWVRRIAREWL